MRKLRSRFTYANVLSTLCLFLLLGGGAYAATQLPKGSVGTKQLKKEAVTPAKLSSAAKSTLTGPQGPKGEAGAKGDTGPKGEIGPKGDEGERGEPGTANVIYSEWAYATAGSAEVFDNTWAKTATVSAPSLTSAMLSKGSVEVFTTFGSEILPLPYRSNAGGTYNTISYTLAPGKITIRRTTDGCKEESCLIPLSSLLQYRYVLVPGGTPAS